MGSCDFVQSVGRGHVTLQSYPMLRLKPGKERLFWTLVFAAGLYVVTPRPQEGHGADYGRPQRIAELANQQIAESSGLAASRRMEGVFWTHNDSGDTPRVFAFDQAGKHLGTCRLRDAEAIDWEDMAAFDRGGKSWLLLADVGDNARRRASCTLYLCEEPSIASREVTATAIRFRYPDGPHNCEAVGVDAQQGVILLAIKILDPQCAIFQLKLPEQPTQDTLVAEPVGSVAVPVATGMAVSPDGRRLVILTYTDGFQFERDVDESWKQAFARTAVRIPLPIRRQGEAICFGRDGFTLYLTSEKTPTPLWEIRRVP